MEEEGPMRSKSRDRLDSGNRSLGSGGRKGSQDLTAIKENLNFTNKLEGANSVAALNTIQNISRPST
jgi:hypothetical protein